jgi:cation diffusion facilitator CzcD-associated flavoprotein CzcO
MEKEGLLNLNPRVGIIGAGPSGLAAAKNLQEYGVTDITVFEKNTCIGGNWAYDEHNNHSSVYETTHIISSKRWSQFDDFPMPAEYSDYPSHEQLLDYFNEYARHFSLVHYIKFSMTVLQVAQIGNNQWRVLVQDQHGAAHQHEFDYLLVANGHHWDPFLPTYPGDFKGQLIHSHQYKKAEPYQGKRVLIVGGGNSACDIAVETARVSERTSISMRRGYHIFPKFIFGKPTDVAVAKIQWMPGRLRQLFIKLIIRAVQGRYQKYGLANPDCGPLEIHPTINSELLYSIRHGKLTTRPGIKHFSGHEVHFVDGSYDDFDVVIFATGYNISFPFFSGEERLNFTNATKVPLYRKMMHPEFETLYFIGLCQPQGCIWPLADYQSKIVARIITGSLQRPRELQKKVQQEMMRPHYRFKTHRRHALEVDYHLFRKELVQMLKNG